MLTPISWAQSVPVSIIRRTSSVDQKVRMASTLPARHGPPEKPVFIPPKRRTASGKSSAGAAATPTRSIYGDQILLVQGTSRCNKFFTVPYRYWQIPVPVVRENPWIKNVENITGTVLWIPVQMLNKLKIKYQAVCNVLELGSRRNCFFFTATGSELS